MPSLQGAALLATLAFAALPTPGEAASADEARAGIDATNLAFETAFNGGDAAGVAAVYTEDALLLPPGEPQVNGREAVEAYWQAAIDAGVTGLDLTSVEVTPLPDGAIEIGRWQVTVPDGSGGTVEVGGNFLVVWRVDESGDWRLHQDIWNDDPAG